MLGHFCDQGVGDTTPNLLQYVVILCQTIQQKAGCSAQGVLQQSWDGKRVTEQHKRVMG